MRTRDIIKEFEAKIALKESAEPYGYYYVSLEIAFIKQLIKEYERKDKELKYLRKELNAYKMFIGEGGNPKLKGKVK